jgi:hypothetical protein
MGEQSILDKISWRIYSYPDLILSKKTNFPGDNVVKYVTFVVMPLAVGQLTLHR